MLTATTPPAVLLLELPEPLPDPLEKLVDTEPLLKLSDELPEPALESLPELDVLP